MRAIGMLGTLWTTAFLLAGCAAAPTNAALATATPTDTIALDLRDTVYDRSHLEVALNQVVDLALRNTGALDHDFTIDRMPVDALVLGEQTSAHQAHALQSAVHAAPGPGKAVTLRLNPRAAGEFTYYCSVSGHREAGMTGTLVVR